MKDPIYPWARMEENHCRTSPLCFPAEYFRRKIGGQEIAGETEEPMIRRLRGFEYRDPTSMQEAIGLFEQLLVEAGRVLSSPQVRNGATLRGEHLQCLAGRRQGASIDRLWGHRKVS